MTTAHSATLAIDELVHERRARGLPTLHLGFGEAGLPVAHELAAALAGAATGGNGYGAVVGSAPAREAAAGWFGRRGVPTGADQVVLAPGSKPLLFGLVAALDGDVVLPRPSWVSYAAQSAFVGRRVVRVPAPAEAGGVPDPDLLEDALVAARADGARPGVLVLTVPDNPTGTVASTDLLARVCAVADRHGLAVVSDEIYAELVHEGRCPTPVTHLPGRTVVTTGLSKSLALGGWRIGFVRTPSGPWGDALRVRLTGVASEVWSCQAGPMQAVATYALGDPPELLARVERSRRLHGRVARAVHARVVAAGARCRPPTAAFYLYPDFSPVAEPLARTGITTGPELATALLERHGVATLPGTAFGEPEGALTLRLASSLLYGPDAEHRDAALAADAPEDLPWVVEALDQLSAALEDLTGVTPGRRGSAGLP